MQHSIPYSPRQRPLWQRPKTLSLIISVLLGIWVLSALLLPPSTDKQSAPENAAQQEGNKVPVKIEQIQAQSYSPSVTLNGVTEPERITLIEAETESKVVKILKQEGETAKAGEVLMSLDIRDRQRRVSEALAILKQRQIERKAAKTLYAQGFQSEVRLAQAEAALASARSQLEQAQLDLSFVTIKAPYDGIIEEVLVEEGDIAGRGFNKQTVMRFVDMSPLIVRGELSEKERGKVHVGDTASIRLSTGQQVSGIVKFIGNVADELTRSFRIEIEIANEDRAISAGLSAEILLKTDAVNAFLVSSSTLVLDDEGVIGIKRVDEHGSARFHPVKTLAQEEDGVWILPKDSTGTLTLITEGAAFIGDGAVVVGEAVAVDEVKAN